MTTTIRNGSKWLLAAALCLALTLSARAGEQAISEASSNDMVNLTSGSRYVSPRRFGIAFSNLWTVVGGGGGGAATNIFLYGGQPGAVQTNGTGDWTVKAIPDNNGSGTNTTLYNPTFVGATNLSGLVRAGAVYVSTSGNDGNAGTFAAPVATLQQAAQLLGGAGTIIVRGGTYFNNSLSLTNCGRLTIRAYNSERPEFWYGYNVAPGDFSALSNGIFTATLSGATLAALKQATNEWDAWSPTGRGTYLHQTNVPYGTPSLMTQGISVTSRRSNTNRTEHTPLVRAASVEAMVNSNACWFLSGTTLYAKFAVSNVAGGLYVSSTNSGDSVIYGGTTAADITLIGLRSYFGRQGFSFSGCGHWRFQRCYSYGAGWSGFDCDDYTYSTVTGDGEIIGCEAAAFNGFGFNFGGWITNEFASVERKNNYWHDYLREGASLRYSVNANVIGDVCFGGRDGQYGFIDSGSHTIYSACYSVSNTVADWQQGDPYGTATSVRLFSCIGDTSQTGLLAEDYNNHLWAVNCQFNATGNAIYFGGNNTTHSLQAFNSSYFTTDNKDLVGSLESLNAANFRVGSVNYGWGSDSQVGQAVYGSPNLISRVIYSASDLATLGMLRAIGTATFTKTPLYSTNLMAQVGDTIDISVPTQTTNAAGNLSFTKLANITGTADQTVVITILPNGADRTLTLPQAWFPDGYSRSPVITNGSIGKLTVNFDGVRTNAAFVLFKSN